MNWSNFIPRANLSIARQGSHLQSPREPGSPGHLWHFVRDQSIRSDKQTNSLAQIQRAVSQMRIASMALSRFHPFKIYSPSQLWPNSATGIPFPPSPITNYWRTFRVRGGLVMTTTVEGIEVDGTDQIEQPYDEIFMFRNDGTAIEGVQEYVVPVNTSYFLFWVEFYTDTTGTDQGVVRYGTDPTVASYTDPDNLNPSWTATNQWTGYPAPDGNHFPLGFVDTQTRAKEGIALVRQFQITDIMASGSTGNSCPMG